jgi:hypothetical protein
MKSLLYSVLRICTHSRSSTTTTASFGTRLYISILHGHHGKHWNSQYACLPLRCLEMDVSLFNRILLRECVWPLTSNGNGEDHIENNTCNTFSNVACAFRTLPRNWPTCHNLRAGIKYLVDNQEKLFPSHENISQYERKEVRFDMALRLAPYHPRHCNMRWRSYCHTGLCFMS